MFFSTRSKWLYAVASSGAVLGFFNYWQSDKHIVKMAKTNNFTPSVKWNYNWDNREYLEVSNKENVDPVENKSNASKKVLPTARRHYLLIRHGQYNTSARTDAERRLTEIGRKQADQVGLRLKNLNLNLTRMVHSTMTRATETCSIIHKQIPEVPVESCPLLREGEPIQPEPPVVIMDAENIKRDSKRIDAAFEKYFHRADISQKADSYEIIVCHANVIRYFVCRLLQFPPEGWLRFGLHHCSMTWVTIPPSGRVYVYAVGDNGYMPQELLTTS